MHNNKQRKQEVDGKKKKKQVPQKSRNINIKLNGNIYNTEYEKIILNLCPINLFLR